MGRAQLAWILQDRTVAGLQKWIDDFKQFHEYVPDDAEISPWTSFGNVWIAVEWDTEREQGPRALKKKL